MATITERVIEQFARSSSQDLETFVGSIGDVLLQDIENLVSDGPNGEPGWSGILDLARVPDYALEWLAQFVGVRLPAGLTAAQKRTRIQNTDGWKRGTVAALRGAILPFLTGNQTVILRERDSSAYHFTVTTYTSQSGDAANQAKILAALVEQKPAGLVMAYQVQTGQDYQSLLTGNPLYSNVFANFATYQGVVTAQPGI